MHLEGELRSQYQRVISDCLASEKLSILWGIFEKVVKENPLILVNKVFEDSCSCLFKKSTELKASQGQKHLGPSKPPNVKWGQFLWLQWLCYLDRCKLACVILDDVESLRFHNKYRQLTDDHKIYTRKKMVSLNPLKYDVIFSGRGRWISKWKIFTLGSKGALSLDHNFSVSSLFHVFGKLWLASELFTVTVHIPILELCGWSSKQQFYFLLSWMTLWTRWWPNKWTGILLSSRRQWQLKR